MPDERYIWAAYILTWVVLLPFVGATIRRLRRAEQAARAAEPGEGR